MTGDAARGALRMLLIVVAAVFGAVAGWSGVPELAYGFAVGACWALVVFLVVGL